MQKTFICNLHDFKVPRVTEIKSVSHPKVTKVYDHVSIPGIGTCPVSKPTGKVDKNKFSISTDCAGWISVEATRDSIEKKLRRLRPDEAAILDEIDSKIQELREQKEEVLRRAWKKAHVVTIKELEEMVHS